jgi:hypothetical protein
MWQQLNFRLDGCRAAKGTPYSNSVTKFDMPSFFHGICVCIDRSRTGGTYIWGSLHPAGGSCYRQTKMMTCKEPTSSLGHKAFTLSQGLLNPDTLMALWWLGEDEHSLSLVSCWLFQWPTQCVVMPFTAYLLCYTTHVRISKRSPTSWYRSYFAFILLTHSMLSF